MSRKGFLFYLFNKNKKPLYTNHLGFVLEGNDNYAKPDGQPAYLQQSPADWSTTQVKYARNTKYWGLNRDLISGLKFPGDGYTILKHVLNTEGYEGLIYLGVMKLDRYTLPYNYTNWHLTEINFVKYKESNSYIQVEALEGGMSKIFKAFENTKYEIEVATDPEHKNVLMDGINLRGRQNYIIGNVSMDPHTGNGFFTFFYLMVKENQEGASTGITLTDSPFVHDDFSYPTEDSYLLGEDSLATDIDVEVSGVLKLRLDILRENPVIRMQVFKSNEDAPFPMDKFDIYNPSGGDPLFTFSGETRDIPYSFTIPIGMKDRLFLHGDIGQGTNTGRPSAWTILEGSTMTVQYRNKYKPTYVKGLYLYRVLEKIVEQMIKDKVLLPTDTGVYFKSDWLKNKKDIIVVGGDNMRGLDTGKIVTSIADLYKSCNHWEAALGIENEKLFIEPMSYVFNESEELVDLGEVENATNEIAEDLLFNTIKTGGPIIEYNDVNGKSEFNQEQVWVTPVTKATKELDLSTPYRRDALGAEFLRISRAGQVTTDDKSDLTVFMLNVQNNIEVDANGVSFQRLFRPAYATLTGIEDPIGVFNVELSPKTTIENHMGTINAIMDKMEGQQVTMSSHAKNSELARTGYSNVDEDAAIIIGSGKAKRWQPRYINFTTKISQNLLPTLNLRPYGKIRFTIKGRLYFAWLMDGGVKPEINDKQTWKVLSHWSNDLSKFQR